MLTKKQIKELPPKPLRDKVRVKFIKGKVDPILVPVLKYNPSTGKKECVQIRDGYTNDELIKLFNL